MTVYVKPENPRESGKSMFAMGEDSDEPAWLQSQGEKRSSNGETEREGSKRVRRGNPSEVQGPVGSILRVRLQNFMCHDDLDW